MTTTGIRALILGLLSLIGLIFPGLIPEGTREAIADHAVAVVSAVLGIWAIFAGHRAVSAPPTEEED